MDRPWRYETALAMVWLTAAVMGHIAAPTVTLKRSYTNYSHSEPSQRLTSPARTPDQSALVRG